MRKNVKKSATEREWPEEFESLIAEGKEVRSGLTEERRAILDSAFVDSKIHERPRKIDHIKCYVERGADINAKDAAGATVMHYLAQKGCYKICDSLLNMGARADLTDKEGRTALHYAALSKKFKLGPIISSFSKKLDINCIDKDGKTPLHLAVLHENATAIVELLNSGADCTIRDCNNETPIDYAERSSRREILTFLKQRPEYATKWRLPLNKDHVAVTDEPEKVLTQAPEKVPEEVFTKQPLIEPLCPNLFSESLLEDVKSHYFKIRPNESAETAKAASNAWLGERSVVLATAPIEKIAKAKKAAWRRATFSSRLQDLAAAASSAVRAESLSDAQSVSDSSVSDSEELSSEGEERGGERFSTIAGSIFAAAASSIIPPTTTSLKRKWSAKRSAFKPTLRAPVVVPEEILELGQVVHRRVGDGDAGRNPETTEWISVEQQQLGSRKHVSELLEERAAKRSKNTEAEVAA